MQLTKRYMPRQQNSCRQLKILALGLGATLVLSGCNLFDDDDEKNVAPTTVTVDLTTQTETPITDMLSASDSNGDSLTYSLDQQAMLGTVTVDDNGQFTYQPKAEVTGSDSFTYMVTDGVNPGVPGMVNITIEALTVSFASYSREVFNQDAGDEPLAVNGRVFTQDVADPDAYNDLLID